MLTKEDIIDEYGIDLNIWEVERFRIRTSESYRKDKRVNLSFDNGRMTGDVDDSGKMLVVPLYHLELRLIPRKNKFTEENIDQLLNSLSEDFKPLLIKPSQYYQDGINAILPIADLHYGLIATKEVEGEEYNVQLAEKYVEDIVSQTKERLIGKEVQKIYLLIGNDLFNSDNLNNTTTKQTPQDSVYSWFHMLDGMNKLLIRVIDSLREVAPVHVINVNSNHDRHTAYACGRMVEQYYRTVDNVSFDNTPLYTKYLMIGKTLFGFTHDIVKKRALETMTTEAKDLWSSCNQAVWLLAHLHSAEQYQAEGVLETYRLPAISGRSRWTTEQHFNSPSRRAQIFLVDDNDGIVDVMNVFTKE